MVSRKRGAGAFTAALFLGYAASLLLACSPLFSWGNYTHAPGFREVKPYSVEDGKLVVPEDKREELLRDCGYITHPGLQDSCKIVIYCQSYDEAAYGRMGCGKLLSNKTSAALLDMALMEREGFEYGQRLRGE